MRHLLRRVIAPIILVIPSLAAAAEPDLQAAYGQLRNVGLDPARVAVVENLVLKKEAGTFQFKSGVLYVFAPVLDKVAGAVFIGEGVFSFQPPAGLEQANLARFTGGQPRLEEPFKEAVLIFADSTFADLSAGAAFKPGTVDNKASGLLHDFRKAFRDQLKTNIEARLLAGLCSARQSLFLADIRGQKHGKLLFSVDPMSGESVSLAHYDLPEVFDNWSSFNPAGFPAAAERALVRTIRMELDTTLDQGGRLEGAATAEFSGTQDGPRVVYVQLAPSLRVSKVAWNDGSELKYIQEAKDKDGDFWVLLPKPLAKGEKYSWKIAYEGDGVIRKAGGGNFFVRERDRWYPKLDVPGDTFNDRAMYSMKFRTPKGLTLVATGKPVKKSQDGKTIVSEWDTEVPYTVVGFNFGDYKAKSAKNADRPITVYANTQLGEDMRRLQVLLENNPRAAAALGMTPGALNTTGVMDRTLTETAAALKVFTGYFGPLPFQNLSVTQQAASSFGQSWPTLIFMPYTSFLDDTARHQLHMDEDNRSRQFYAEVGAHEVSHQWWGHLVGWKDYHDQWLSEGFAQFSAGLFLHVADDVKKYKSFLQADKEFILSPLPDTTERANDAGPIWLGHRLSTDKRRGASRLIYAKGGYVLHMLRMMMYDYAKRDDGLFVAMMQDFVRTYAGKSASTEDFKAICDKHFGMDMGWFFKQWVYGTAVPKIAVEYTVRDDPGGPVLVVDARQQNAPDDFRSILPVLVRTKAGAMAARLSITGPSLHREMRLREKPETVEFNTLSELLCELDIKKR